METARTPVRVEEQLILDPRPVLSRDPVDAQARISAVFGPHRLEPVSAAPLDVRLYVLRLPSLTLGDISHGAEVDVTPGRLRTYYHVNAVLAGHTRTVCGREVGATEAGMAAILSAEEPTSMRWSADCRQLAIKIDRAALEREAEALLGRPCEQPVVFNVLMDTRYGGGRSWLRSVLTLANEVRENPLLLDQPLILRRFESLIVSQLLATQPNNYTAALQAVGRAPARPRRVQAVVDLIEERAAEALTATDLARASGTSLRSLQEDFHQYLGVSPMVYLRNIRLARARQELESIGPGSTTTVAAVAYKWWFSHVPRYAAAYRERYGELPSETIRR